MYCHYCGSDNKDSATFCTNCGADFNAAPASFQDPFQPQQSNPYQANPYPYQPAKPTIPPEYKPISAWGYFGYNLLFAIPLVGFILLIVFSCGGTSNVNLKNYARSFWCGLVIALALALAFLLMGIALGASF